VPNAKPDMVASVARLSESLRNARYQHLQLHLSLRQLIRALQMQASGADLFRYLRDSCLSDFLPESTRTSFDSLLKQAGIVATAKSSTPTHSLNTNASCEAAAHTSLQHVPIIEFFDNAAQETIMHAMKKELDLGHHLLLVGNQGVGKNKLCDKMLQQYRLARQYIQLHRDITVQAITAQTGVKAGAIGMH
jgi:von Willebrand factor A domain-containing protein 8